MGVTLRSKGGTEISNNTRLMVMLIAMSISWFLGVVLFIIGILLIVGVLGDAHPFVIEAMNCNDYEKRSVGCSRVYGYRAEGVTVIILSFFLLAWAVIFSIATVVIFFRMRRGSQPQGGQVIFPYSRTSPPAQQFATSEA